MKNVRLLLPAILSLAIFSCQSPADAPQQDQENNEADSTAAAIEVYGDESMTTDNAIPAAELLAMMEGQDSVEVKVRGTIEACCQKKGCWMDMKIGDEESMTVRFKDYGFFVPMNSAGRDAVIEGIAKREVQSVDWLRHKAEDAGKSEEEIAAITEPEVKVSFLAKGVILE